MSFHLLELAHLLIRQLRAPAARIAMRDKSLASQLRRAASSVALNSSEARQRAGGDQLHLYRVAAGSAAETGTAIGVALGWAYVDDAAVAEPLATLDRINAILWRLTHPR